jgi:hypothetical protein
MDFLKTTLTISDVSGNFNSRQTGGKIIFGCLKMLLSITSLEQKKHQAVEQNDADGNDRRVAPADFFGQRDYEHSNKESA